MAIHKTTFIRTELAAQQWVRQSHRNQHRTQQSTTLEHGT